MNRRTQKSSHFLIILELTIFSYRTFLKTGDWKLVASNQGNVLMANVYRVRIFLEFIF